MTYNPYPTYPLYPIYHPPTPNQQWVIQPVYYPYMPTKEDFDKLKKDIEEIKELLKNKD